MLDHVSAEAPTVSLIICSKNRADKLRRCLASISDDEMLSVKGELILIDNNSSDNTWAVMEDCKRSYKSPVHIVHESKGGLSSARNAGILKARGATLIFTDDDCYLTKGYLVRAASIFDNGKFDYCGGPLWGYDPTASSSGTRYFDERRIISPRAFIPASFIPGANMVFSRRVVDRVGLFDEDLGAGTFLWSGEDADYLSRASWEGFVGALIPELIIWHDHGRRAASLDEVEVRDGYDYGRGAYFFKCILHGRLAYISQWVKRAFLNWPMFLRELRGAWRYSFRKVFCR